MDEGLAKPGEVGEWRIHGDFFMCSVNDDGELSDVTDESIKLYTAMFEAQDTAAMKAQNRAQTRKP